MYYDLSTSDLYVYSRNWDNGKQNDFRKNELKNGSENKMKRYKITNTVAVQCVAGTESMVSPSVTTIDRFDAQCDKPSV